MRRKRRQLQQSHHLHIQQSKIIFDNQLDTNDSCRICSRPGPPLINPCECSNKYHERCLLLYIRGVIKRGLRENNEVDLTSIKCKKCENQFHFSHTYASEYSCSVFMKRMGKNGCNAHVMVITMLFVIIIITVVIFINFEGKQNKNLRYGLIGILAILGIMLLGFISHFIHSYLVLKKLVLERVLQMIEVRSLASNSSDQNKISDDCEVVIRT